jgi:hypothetical protein
MRLLVYLPRNQPRPLSALVRIHGGRRRESRRQGNRAPVTPVSIRG